MAPKKRNAFLDPEDSGDDDRSSQGYDSEAEELRKGGRNAKRRKVDGGYSSEDDGQDEDRPTSRGSEDDDGDDDKDEAEPVEDGDGDATTAGDGRGGSTKTPKALKLKNLLSTEAAIKRSGVVYIARIPPFMRPRKLRTLLEPHGKLGRVYLAEEDATARKKRLKGGGNRRRLYLEGWVEFASKADAKRCCELLNGRNIGGRKRGRYYDSMWTLKYLKGFKWHHLTEQMAAENAARDSRMRAEIGKAQRENRDFVLNVQKAKMLDNMESKAEAKRFRGKKVVFGDDGDDGEADEGRQGEDAGPPKPRREKIMSFKQTPVARKTPTDAGDKQPDRVARVLSAIF